MINKLLKRLFFYSLIYGLFFIVFDYIEWNLLGKDGFKLLAPVSAVFALIQTLNLTIIGKFGEFEKKEINIGYWPRERLLAAVDNERKVTISRAFAGMAMAVFSGFLSAYMMYLDNFYVPLWLISLAVSFVFISSLILVLTLVGFFRVINFETELAREINHQKRKKSSLDDLDFKG